MPIDQTTAIFIADSLSLDFEKTKKVLSMLIDEDCTVPFISRYRKEQTGGMDEVQVTKILTGYNNYIEVEKRRSYILKTIKGDGKLTKELECKIN